MCVYDFFQVLVESSELPNRSYGFESDEIAIAETATMTKLNFGMPKEFSSHFFFVEYVKLQ